MPAELPVDPSAGKVTAELRLPGIVDLTLEAVDAEHVASAVAVATAARCRGVEVTRSTRYVGGDLYDVVVRRLSQSAAADVTRAAMGES